MNKIILFAFIYLSITACDIMKSVTIKNKTHQHLSIEITADSNQRFFIHSDSFLVIHLSAQGKQRQQTWLQGFGKWQNSDVFDLSAILLKSRIALNAGTSFDEMSQANPLRINRRGIFGNRLKIIIE
ncbi:MAG: hypothetical protein ABIQ02_09670 [Saprospiraceae bacterium]